MNIRGYECDGGTAKWWQSSSVELHTDSTYSGCDCSAWRTGAVSGENNFIQNQPMHTQALQRRQPNEADHAEETTLPNNPPKARG